MTGLVTALKPTVSPWENQDFRSSCRVRDRLQCISFGRGLQHARRTLPPDTLLIIPIVLEYADAHIPLAHIAASLACQMFN